MILRKELKWSIGSIGIILCSFLILFTIIGNNEFRNYIVFMIASIVGLLIFDRRYKFSPKIYWGVFACYLLDISGEAIAINGVRIYELILIPLSSSFPILRYDQLVHLLCSAIATILFFEIAKPYVKDFRKAWPLLLLILFFAGMGVGAISEIVEFHSALTVTKAGVGGYLNTALDLIFNAIGVAIGLLFTGIFGRSAIDRK